MSNFHFGLDDYDLNYYPPEADDGMGGVDWDKVERVEIEYDVYVKERTCRDASLDRSTQFYCSECECTVDVPIAWGAVNYCPGCGARVKEGGDD